MHKPLTVAEALDLLRQPPPVGEEMYVLEADTSLSTRGEAVPYDHPEEAVILGPAGRKIPQALAKRLGLLDKPAEPDHKAVHKADTEDKAVHRAAAHK